MPINPLRDAFKAWWAGPVSWKTTLFIALALVAMLLFPLVAMIYWPSLDK